MQHLASDIAYNDPKLPDLKWMEDMTGLSYLGKVITLDKLRSGLHKLNDKVAQLLADLSGGELLPCEIPDQLNDAMSKDDINYSFLNHHSFTNLHLGIVQNMFKVPEFNFSGIHVASSNELILDQHKMKNILQVCAEINKLLMILVHTVSSQPPRASEEVDLRLRNGHRHRNIFLVLGKIWRVIHATKTENITKHSAFIPSVLPSEITQHLLYYLVHIRPLEIFLAEKVYDIQTKELYQEFLYVQMGKRVEPDQFSKAMSEEMEVHCGISLGVSEWRHIAIALKRAFIHELLYSNHTRQDVGDTAASHSTCMALLGCIGPFWSGKWGSRKWVRAGWHVPL